MLYNFTIIANSLSSIRYWAEVVCWAPATDDNLVLYTLR
jgi:hypothetical protein